MDILYEDSRILVCIKPAGVLSAGDEPGGMVDLLRKELGDEHACVRSVHRLDAQVSGLMVFARSQAAAGILSGQVREHVFEKEYLAVVHGRFEGCFRSDGRSALVQPLASKVARHGRSRQGREAGAAVLRGAGLRRTRGRIAGQDPPAHRTDAPDPHPVFLPRSCALRRPEIRCGRRGWLRVDCALVVAARVFAPAK